jgi:putative sigma-54 modulation protein
MNVTVTGQHMEVTPAIRQYVVDKFERISRHFDHVIDVAVVLNVEKLRKHVEANVHVQGKDLFAETTHEDMYAAIDALVDILDRQVIRHKEKRNEHRNQPPLKHLAIGE